MIHVGHYINTIHVGTLLVGISHPFNVVLGITAPVLIPFVY